MFEHQYDPGARYRPRTITLQPEDIEVLTAQSVITDEVYKHALGPDVIEMTRAEIARSLAQAILEKATFECDHIDDLGWRTRVRLNLLKKGSPMSEPIHAEAEDGPGPAVEAIALAIELNEPEEAIGDLLDVCRRKARAAASTEAERWSNAASALTEALAKLTHANEPPARDNEAKAE